MVTDWAWDFGDGSAIVADQNPVYAYAEEGIYEVNLTVSNGSCYSTYQQEIEVGNMTGTSPIDGSSGWRVYPNPARESVTLEFSASNPERSKLNISNATGVVVSTQWIEPGVTHQPINVSGLPAGTYQFQIFGKNGVSVQRLTILH